MQGLEDVGGLHELKVNGVQYNLKGDPTYQPGGKKHTPIISNGKTHGYKVEDVPAKVSGTITDVSSLDLVELQELKDCTVELKKPNGKVLVINHASFSGDLSVNGAEGEISFEFTGPGGKGELMP